MAHAPHQILFQAGNRNYDVFNLHSDLSNDPRQLGDNVDPPREMVIPEEAVSSYNTLEQTNQIFNDVNEQQMLNSNDVGRQPESRKKDQFWLELS